MTRKALRSVCDKHDNCGCEFAACCLECELAECRLDRGGRMSARAEVEAPTEKRSFTCPCGKEVEMTWPAFLVVCKCGRVLHRSEPQPQCPRPGDMVEVSTFDADSIVVVAPAAPQKRGRPRRG